MRKMYQILATRSKRVTFHHCLSWPSLAFIADVSPFDERICFQVCSAVTKHLLHVASLHSLNRLVAWKHYLLNKHTLCQQWCLNACQRDICWFCQRGNSNIVLLTLFFNEELDLIFCMCLVLDSLTLVVVISQTVGGLQIASCLHLFVQKLINTLCENRIDLYLKSLWCSQDRTSRDQVASLSKKCVW